MGLFERFLSVWVALGIAAGVGVLVEVPVMLSLVALVNAWQPAVPRTGAR